LEPLVASTDQYLADKIRDERRKLERSIQELGKTLILLEANYRSDVPLEEQDYVLEQFGDMVELATEVQYRTVLITGLEEIPRVG
jgi:hypothetical protein